MIAVREPSKFLFMSGGFFEELQRRKVYRVAAAYVIAAGFIIQMGSAIFPAWELPNWTFRLVVVLLLIGFPIALTLAWAFDVTPEGIRATKGTAAETHLRRNMIILVAAGVIVSVAAGFFLLPRASAPNIDKSIAVLPFKNLSGDPDNAYFADGIQDDILTNLSKIGDLKVISRNEKARLDRRPTQDPNAYLLFVQAHDYATRTDMFHDSSLKAAPLFEQAIKLDPNFALAFAGLSMVESWAYHSFDPVPARREKARHTAEEALRLQPDLPEAHLALGFSYYYGDRDYQRALAEFEMAKRGLPNEAEAYMAIGAIQRRQGKWIESTENLEKAAALDPKNVGILCNLGYSYMAQRNFEAADKVFDRALLAEPQSLQAAGMKAALAVLWTGDLSAVEKQFSSVPPGADQEGLITWLRVGILTLERKFPEALQLAQQFRGEALATATTAPCPKAFLEGTLYRYQGDKEKARIALEQARVVAEKLVREAPQDSARHGQLGVVLAALRQKEEAINEGKRAVELLPESQDAFDGPQATAALAQIYAWTGEFDEAFRLLDHLLDVPNGLTVTILKLEPMWDPLRKDPRFQALIDKYGLKT